MAKDRVMAPWMAIPGLRWLTTGSCCITRGTVIQILERMDDYGAFLLIYNLKIGDYLSILMTGPTCYSEKARNKGKHPQIAYDRNTLLQLNKYST